MKKPRAKESAKDERHTRVIGVDQHGNYVVATGRRTTMRVTPELLRQLVDAHIGDAATKAGLSKREREVLVLLMAGRTIGEIATALDITARTAKCHQSNVLVKLDAESRLDLLRLLL